MRYLLIFLFLLGSLSGADRYRLKKGMSMYPLLVPGDTYYVIDTPYDQVRTGMIVMRYHQGRIFVHMVGSPLPRNQWITYGINNSKPDPLPMKRHHYKGEVCLTPNLDS